VPLRPSALGFNAGFVALETALRTPPISELVTELSGGTRSTVEDTVPVTLLAVLVAVPTVLLTVWSVEPIAFEPVPSAVHQARFRLSRFRRAPLRRRSGR
jgi:hypothetical protein